MRRRDPPNRHSEIQQKGSFFTSKGYLYMVFIFARNPISCIFNFTNRLKVIKVFEMKHLVGGSQNASIGTLKPACQRLMVAALTLRT